MNAMLTIFQVLSLENWTDGMMYNYMDSNNTYIAAVYFILLVIFGAFFIMNLVLAQIIESFDEEQRASTDKNGDANKHMVGLKNVLKAEIKYGDSEDSE